jgi:hypothetical protein
VSRSLQVFHHDIFVFRKYFRKTVGARQQVHRLVTGLSALCFQVGNAPDVRQPDSLANLTRHRQRIAGEHLYRNAQALKFGNQLLCIRPGRIIERHQSE